jgi:hypothetical protein
MGIIEKIKDIEKEMSRTQKNKATEGHLGLLKAKLAKLRTELLAPPPGSNNAEGEGFAVARCGDGRVALIGFPSVGKSSLLKSVDVAFVVSCPFSSSELFVCNCYPPLLLVDQRSITQQTYWHHFRGCCVRVHDTDMHSRECLLQ